MNKIRKDKFVSNLIGYNCYISTNTTYIKNITKLKRPFFMTLKSHKKIKINKNKDQDLKIKLISNTVNFERKYKKKRAVYLNCRKATKQDIFQIKKIAKEKTSNSRFVKDIYISHNFKKKYRTEWVLNFFKKKRGDFLIVAHKNEKIYGFILLVIKNSNFIIDLIVSSAKYQKRKVASSLINHVNNTYMQKEQKILAGTQSDNLIAIKMYKKLGFIKKKRIIYTYHIHKL